MSDTEIQVEGRRLKLSNLEKVMYPVTGFTKGEVIDYYTRVAPALLPHLRGRPLTLKRYPNGVDGGHFYEKRCPSHRPEWVATAPIWSNHNDGIVDYCVVNDTASLTWVAQLASLELHTSLSTAADIACPTMVVFDLDPGPPAALLECCRVGLHLREMFDQLGLQCVPKTSGSKGLQVYVPLNTPTTYDETKPFAHAVARLLEKQHPKEILSVMDKAARAGKVFVDWSQNDQHKTTVCVYSLRARPNPTVSTPLSWSEVEAAVEAGDPFALEIEAREVLDRVIDAGDLFAPVAELRQHLPALR